MADAVPARLTPTPPFTARDGRKFGLTVGVAFVVFALISRWRGHEVAPLAMASIGGALVLGGLAIPTRLGPVYRAWMHLGLLLSKVTTPLFMGLVYFLVITPMGLIMRMFGRNPVRHEAKDGSYWVVRTPPADPAERMRHQF